MTNENRRKGIITFLIITAALSAIFYYFIISSGTLQAAGGLYIFGLMWCPGIAAIITRLIYQRNLRGFGWRLGKLRYLLLGYAIPFLLALIAYAVIWLTGLGGRFYDEEFVKAIANRYGLVTQSPAMIIAFYLAISGIVGVISSCVTALGEELGWRGFLAPELAKTTTFTKTALISGVIWAVWHYPGILFADYNTDTPNWFAIITFTIYIVGISFVITWLRLKSGSLWTAMLLHASQNLFVQAFFDPLTIDTKLSPYITGEFGIAMVIVYAAAAFIFWKRRGELEIR